MSYIFDALKKSQAARGYSEAAEDPIRSHVFSNRAIIHHIPAQETSIKPSVASKWFRLIAIALAVNGAITVYHHLSDPRHETQAEKMTAQETKSVGSANASTDKTLPVPNPVPQELPGSSKSAGTAQDRLFIQTHRNELTNTASLPPPVRTDKPIKSAVISSSEREIPYLWQKSAGFQQNIPSMNVDMLVYADKPNQRFAFVNMRKVREGELIAKGIILEEITPNELLISFRDEKFRLTARR